MFEYACLDCQCARWVKINSFIPGCVINLVLQANVNADVNDVKNVRVLYQTGQTLKVNRDLSAIEILMRKACIGYVSHCIYT